MEAVFGAGGLRCRGVDVSIHRHRRRARFIQTQEYATGFLDYRNTHYRKVDA